MAGGVSDFVSVIFVVITIGLYCDDNILLYYTLCYVMNVVVMVLNLTRKLIGKESVSPRCR